MFLRTLGLILGSQHTSTTSVQAETIDSDITMENSEDESTMPCFFLDALPPEIRVQIYGYLILSEHRLVFYNNRKLSGSRVISAESGKLAQLDISVFLLNKQIYEEAADIFYTFNRFATKYEDFCFCWSGKHIMLDKSHIKHFKIQAINFDEESHPELWDRCRVCDTQAFWLMKSLSRLPKLMNVTLSFEDAESFAVCLGTVTRKLKQLGKNAKLETGEIGRVFITGIPTHFELRLPSLLRTWPHALAQAAEPYIDGYDSDDDYEMMSGFRPFSETDRFVYMAIRDVLYHAIAIGTTTEELQPLMQKVVSPKGVHLERLRAQEKAEFTTVLTGCLADIIADDENVHMADRRDLVPLLELEDSEKNGRPRASSAVSRRSYSYMTRF